MRRGSKKRAEHQGEVIAYLRVNHLERMAPPGGGARKSNIEETLFSRAEVAGTRAVKAEHEILFRN